MNFVVVLPIMLFFYELDLNLFLKIFKSLLIPIITFFIIRIILKSVIVKYTFVQNTSENGFIINNMRIFNSYIHFTFFLDCFVGLLTCFTRVLFTAILSILYLSRLDVNNFNNELKQFDNAYTAYSAALYLDNMYNNHVMKVFCNLCLNMTKYKNESIKNDNLESKKEEASINRLEILTSESHKSKRYRNRWFLFITLANNYELVKCRKRCSQYR